MIYLSIVIPNFNSLKIYETLNSIQASVKIRRDEIEIIIVDDCSDGLIFSKIVKFIGNLRKSEFKNIRIIRLKKNSGPAHARNMGVKYAAGEVVLFLDSDVVLYKNTLFEVIHSFKTDKDLYALTGVWDKHQNQDGFFPKFKALRDWSYWINERDPRNYYYLFSTRVAAIKRDLFKRLGGFDETYKAALVEDIELTYRIARRYAVVFNPKVIVHHEFEDFPTIAKKYFLRSFYWSRIYRERKKFDPVATTGKEAVTTLSAGAAVGSGVISILSYLGNLRDLSRISLAGMLIFVIIHILGVRKFLGFCFREEGFLFSIKSLFTGYILYLIILSGAALSFLYPAAKIEVPRTRIKF